MTARFFGLLRNVQILFIGVRALCTRNQYLRFADRRSSSSAPSRKTQSAGGGCDAVMRRPTAGGGLRHAMRWRWATRRYWQSIVAPTTGSSPRRTWHWLRSCPIVGQSHPHWHAWSGTRCAPMCWRLVSPSRCPSQSPAAGVEWPLRCHTTKPTGSAPLGTGGRLCGPRPTPRRTGAPDAANQGRNRPCCIAGLRAILCG